MAHVPASKRGTTSRCIALGRAGERSFPLCARLTIEGWMPSGSSRLMQRLLKKGWIFAVGESGFMTRLRCDAVPGTLK